MSHQLFFYKTVKGSFHIRCKRNSNLPDRLYLHFCILFMFSTYAVCHIGHILARTHTSQREPCSFRGKDGHKPTSNELITALAECNAMCYLQVPLC